MPRKNREEWLEKAVELLRPILAEAELELGKYTVATGPCGTKVLGVCFNGSVAKDGETRHIIIDMSIEDPIVVLSTLLHEMVHAALPDSVHHNGPFKRAVQKLGMRGKPTVAAADPGTDLYDRLSRIATRLGHYPHVPLKIERKRRGKRNRTPYPKIRSQVVPTYWMQIRPELLVLHGLPEHGGKPMVVDKS